MVHVDRLKKEWVAVFIDLPLRRNLVGIQQGTYQYNQLSKKRKLSQKGKMNSPEDEFVPLREKGAKWIASPRGRFISPRENDAGRFKEFSSRKKACSLRGKFPPLNDKISGKASSPKKKAWERLFILSSLCF